MDRTHHITNDLHALRLNYWESEDYDLEVIHPQSCTVWFGCTFREKWGVQRLDGCPNYHHAHASLDCPIAHMTEYIGLGDTLFASDAKIEDESLEVLKRHMGEVVPVTYDFTWGVYGYYEPEYDEELIWKFKPYYTHTWRPDMALCSVCGATKKYVHETNKECDHGQPE